MFVAVEELTVDAEPFEFNFVGFEFFTKVISSGDSTLFNPLKRF